MVVLHRSDKAPLILKFTQNNTNQSQPQCDQCVTPQIRDMTTNAAALESRVMIYVCCEK